MSTPDASIAKKYYRSHYNQWCCLHWMLRGSTRQIVKSPTVNCCRVLFMTCWHKFQTIFNGRFIASRQTLAVVARRVRCRHGVTHLSSRTKATSVSDRRPSAPWVLSSAGKLIRHLHGSYFFALSFRRRFPLLFFYLPSLSFCYSARLFTECSLLHITSRHAPYCWLATSLFWYSAPTQFSKAFLKNYIPHL